MGFFSKLKEVVAGVDKGATIEASVLPRKAGQVAGGVAQASGVVTAVVQQIQSKSGAELPPEEAQKQATLATAVAVDDHEERMKALEAELAALRAAAAQGGQAGQAGQAKPAGQSGASGGSGQSGQPAPTGQTGSGGGAGKP